MNKIVVLITIVIASATLALADGTGTVTTSSPAPAIVNGQWLEVHSYVPERELTAREKNFLDTVPADSGLREAVRQLLQANVCHVPSCGRYVAGTSADYWRMYQVWTAPFHVQVPVKTERTIERVVTQTIPQFVPIAIPAPVQLPLRQYIAPAGVSAVWTPVLPVATGSMVVGQWQDRASLALLWVPRIHDRECKPPDETCGPGEPGPEPPPNGGLGGNPSGEINQPLDQATHNTGGQKWDPWPSHFHVADPVMPGQ